MAQQSRVQTSLGRINDRAGRELDRIGAHLPPVAEPSIPFDQYLPAALAHAQQDEKFARELARALHQAARLGG